MNVMKTCKTAILFIRAICSKYFNIENKTISSFNCQLRFNFVKYVFAMNISFNHPNIPENNYKVLIKILLHR